MGIAHNRLSPPPLTDLQLYPRKGPTASGGVGGVGASIPPPSRTGLRTYPRECATASGGAGSEGAGTAVRVCCASCPSGDCRATNCRSGDDRALRDLLDLLMNYKETMHED